MSILNGAMVVAAAGARVALAAVRTPAHWVIIQAKSTNGGMVYIGGPAVSNISGPELAKTDSITLPPVGNTLAYDLADIYIDAAVNGEGVKFIWDK